MVEIVRILSFDHRSSVIIHTAHGKPRETCMGNVGARNISDFQQTEIIIAPSIKTEGKLFQTVQSVGMGTR